jgi:predicted transposase YbfD/YdcC
VSPEEAGLVGCWQFVAVQRERIPLDPKKEPTTEVGYYATSLTGSQMGDPEISEAIRGHWSAIENGVHHRRDVSFGEDRCRVRNRQAAEVLATFRNLAIALYEMDLERGQARARSMGTWMKRQTFGKALGLLKG